MKDYFINISANYNRSCFACPIEYLVRFRGPVRTSEPQEEVFPYLEISLFALNWLFFLKGESRLSIPKELWRIVDHLFKNGMNEEDLFLQSGVEEVRISLSLSFFSLILSVSLSFSLFLSFFLTFKLSLSSFLQEITAIRECLDTGDAFSPSMSIHSMVGIPSVFLTLYLFISILFSLSDLFCLPNTFSLDSPSSGGNTHSLFGNDPHSVGS